jgi:predicted RNA-binding protein
MSRKYWLDLFTGKTWDEFLKNGATVSGFRENRKRMAAKIHPGDYLICYLTGISRFIGVLEAKSECYPDTKPIWTTEIFPIRFKVELVLKLEPKTAVPVLTLRDRLSIFTNIKPGRQWSGFFRGSPTEFKPGDAQIIIDAMEDASRNPVERDYDQRKYWRHAKVYESREAGTVTVPDYDKEESAIVEPVTEKVTHEEMQWLLLKLGSDLGLDVWIARNDRNREYNGISFQTMPRLRKELPMQFDEATNKTVELIDVLWLDKNAITAAFEVEHTSAIYSGLLRMSDLIVMQPNIKIRLYIVAPDERREKVVAEVNRPTFARLNPPLPTVCQFIPYSALKKEIEQIGDRVKHMKPQFIEDIAEDCIT